MAVDGEGIAEIAIDTALDPTGAAVVILAGELDSSTAASLDAALAGILAERPNSVIFDLGELQFMDSAGIAVLIGAAKASDVRLRNPSRIVRRVVEVTGLSHILPIEP